jgi:hypothetical protein
MHIILDIRSPDGNVRPWAEAKRDMKLALAKHYLRERGLAPMRIGTCWSRPYVPPTIDIFGSQLQEALLNVRRS